MTFTHILKTPGRWLAFLALSAPQAVFAQSPIEFDAVMDFDSSFLGEPIIPVVLTASRMRQSQLDVPASVTVIEAQTIADLGFKDIEEIFRLVPGMLVAYHSEVGEKTPSVSYHGTNLPEHRRLQVLIDGRSVYKPGLAKVEWADIPLAIEDIARIEVIRGPNSAMYGANSYLGVINILTKLPQDETGAKFKVTAGGRDVANSYVNVSGKVDNTHVRWTVGSKQKSGFDVLNDLETTNRDSISAVYTTVRTHTQLTDKLNVQWQAGYQNGLDQQREVLDMIYFSPEDNKAQDIYLWGKINADYSATQFAHVQVYQQRFIRTTEFSGCWDLEDDNGNPIPSTCGDVNENIDESKTEIEYQHSSIWAAGLRSVLGARLRLDVFDSETFNDGYSDNLNSSLFANVEYKFLPNLVLNAGGMYENDDLNGEYFSPRVALNTNLSPTQTLRFIYSQATRAPNMYEQNGQLIYVQRNAYTTTDPLDANAVKTPIANTITKLGVIDDNLDAERIYSKEISYFGLYPQLGAQLDIKLFYDELSSLISENLDKETLLTNENRLRMSGIEGQVHWQANASNDFTLGFSYIDTDYDLPGNNVKVEQERALSADRSGSLSWVHQFSEDTKLATTYYHVENWNKFNYTFSRLDLNGTQKYTLDEDYVLTLQAAVQYRFDDDPIGRNKNNYLDKHFIYASAQLAF